MPISRSSVRGLSRDIRFEVQPDETCEHMMRRVDRDTTEAVCRHLVGAMGTLGTPVEELAR